MGTEILNIRRVVGRTRSIAPAKRLIYPMRGCLKLRSWVLRPNRTIFLLGVTPRSNVSSILASKIEELLAYHDQTLAVHKIKPTKTAL